MRILIDTNIFIYRENYHIIPSNLQILLKILNDLVVQILVHPLSAHELEKDRNHERSEITLSKIKTYPILDNSPSLEVDQHFPNIVGQTNNANELVDNNLLYCVYKNAVDFMITEDRGIHRKSDRLGISDRVFDIDEALEYFRKQLSVEKVPTPPALKYVPVHNLDINDPIFTSLKEEYDKFLDWWEKISREGRKAWVYFKGDRLGAILIYKIEDEAIASKPPLQKKRRLKLSTFKVTYTGYKIGELFIKNSTTFAINNNIDELYLTHFTKPEDYLVELIENFGFYNVAEKNGEEVYIKKLVPDEKTKEPLEISRKFYPSVYDGEGVEKFVVPIRPDYHNRLFTDYQPRQTILPEFEGELIIEGNTIKKAYLSHSRIRKMSEGDILLFYRSVDERRITSLGVIERVYHDIRNPDEIIRYVGKRSVYTKKEIEEIAKKHTKVILFRQHFHLKNPLALDYLRTNNILSGAPQSIVRIPHEKYLQIKRGGGINERFTIN
jgi:predicted nucleic acid-binding protein